MTLLIKLLIVHLIVDFTLQWRAMLADKQNQRFRSPYLYLHGLLHGLLTLAILADLNYFYGALIIFVSHTIIDGLKLTLQTKKFFKKSQYRKPQRSWPLITQNPLLNIKVTTKGSFQERKNLPNTELEAYWLWTANFSWLDCHILYLVCRGD